MKLFEFQQAYETNTINLSLELDYQSNLNITNEKNMKGNNLRILSKKYPSQTQQ